ncbi:SPRY-domain-containing protein [Serendipita vermifera]|nr:SPRY-domain-containing protein [Serendipita vermifera]
MPPPVPIPSSSSSSSARLEHLIANLEEVGRTRPGRRDSGLFPSTSTTTALTSTTPPIYVSPHAVSSSYQPRVIRPSTSLHDAGSLSNSHSISPTRYRNQSSQGSHRPLMNARSQAILQRSSPPFTIPTYLENAILFNLIRGGLPPPQPYVPEPRLASDPTSTTTDSDDSSNLATGGTRGRSHGAREHTSWPKSLSIPTRWSETDKNHHLIISPDGKDVSFNSSSTTLETREAAAVRAECPIPAACGIYYYEVTVLDKGNKGQISIGFATKDLNLSKLPGWEAGSWGYHGDDGLSFSGLPRSGTEYGPRYSTDDIIGCGINFFERNAFYTKNGILIGSVFSDIPEQDLYPAIGLRTANESIRTNFGDTSFCFDIDAHVAQVKLKAWKEVENSTLVSPKPNENGTNYHFKAGEAPKGNIMDDVHARAFRMQEENLRPPMADLVMDYLIIQGFGKTAKAFQNQVSQKTLPKDAIKHISNPLADSMDVDDHTEYHDRSVFEAMERRTQITRLITAGDIDSALSSIKAYFPDALTYESGLVNFKLRCRRFIELVLEAHGVKKSRAADVDTSITDGAGAGAVAAEGANAMDLDDDDNDLMSPSTLGSSWALNGSGPTPFSLASKSKGKQTTRRRSSGSRPSSTQGRASSRGRKGSESLINPTSSSSEVIKQLERVLEYGTTLQQEWERDERQFIKDKLHETLGLLAFDNPADDPRSKDLVSQEARLELAEDVNKAILATTIGVTSSSLEQLYRHTGTAMQALGAINVGSGAFMDVSRIVKDF